MSLAARYAVTAGQSDDLQGLQQEACHVAATGLRADLAKLLVYQADRHDFLVQAGVGWRPGVVGRSRLAADAGTVAGLVWLAGEPVIANALAEDKRFRTPHLLPGHGIASCIGVPVSGDGLMTFGVLEVDSCRRREFAADDVCFLQLLAHSLAAARGRLVRQACHDEQAARRSDDQQMSLHEMQHRIRNDLQGICSSLDREVRGLDDPTQRAGYDRVRRRVLALVGLYDHLLGVQAGGIVDMGAYLPALCTKIALGAELASRGIALGIDIQPWGMPIDQAGRLAIAVNELVANAVEHAFPDGRSGTITVRLLARGVDGAGCPLVIVRDDGCGFQGPRPGSAGLGFVDRLVRGAGGVLTRSDGCGTEWRIALPA